MKVGTRWTHTAAVARHAELLVRKLCLSDGQLLVAAAWLHDIGYASELATTGFHPLDGARYVEGHGQHRLACLVANHTGALEEARLRGLEKQLVAFPDERSLLSAGLVYCDLMCGPKGEVMTPQERRADVERRHGCNSVVSAGLSEAWPDLITCVSEVNELLERAS